MLEELDKTILNINAWIDKKLQDGCGITELAEVVEMIKALAELMTARANLI